MKVLKIILFILFLLLYQALQVTAQTCGWQIDPEYISSYDGHYEFHQKRILYIRQEDGIFWGKMTGFSELKMTPSGHHEFYFQDIDAKVSFTVDKTGHASQLSFTREDTQLAPKINLNSQSLKKKVLKEYEGVYSISDQNKILVFQKGGHLYAKQNGKDLKLVPLRKHLFYSPKTVMKIGFNLDFDDKIKSLTLYVGQAMEAQKVM